MLNTGFREATRKHADQVLRVPAGGPGRVRSAGIRAARGRRGVHRTNSHRFPVHTRGRRAALQQRVGVAAGEPNADGRRRRLGANGARAYPRGGVRGQGDEHLLQLAAGRRQCGCGSAQRRPVRPAGGVARGAHAGRKLRRVVGRRKRPDRLTTGGAMSCSSPHLPPFA